jgi:hypothetical protein
MALTETFVVRIYHRNRLKEAGLAGIVESVVAGRVQSFSSFDELRAILEGRRFRGKSGNRSRRSENT